MEAIFYSGPLGRELFFIREATGNFPVLSDIFKGSLNPLHEELCNLPDNEVFSMQK
jgi:hypothetical protein